MSQRRSKRPLRCPVCTKGRLADESIREQTSHVKLLPPEQAAEASLFIKCPKCSSEIGVRLTAH